MEMTLNKAAFKVTPQCCPRCPPAQQSRLAFWHLAGASDLQMDTRSLRGKPR